MGKLKLEALRRVEQDWLQSQEIVEYGEERLEEAKSFAHAPNFNPLEDIEAIDIDDITALMAYGKNILLKNLLSNLVYPLCCQISVSSM